MRASSKVGLGVGIALVLVIATQSWRGEEPRPGTLSGADASTPPSPGPGPWRAIAAEEPANDRSPAPPDSRASDAPRHELRIRTGSPEGIAVPGVRLELIADPRPIDLGETDESGLWAVAASEVPGGSLVATKEGYGAQTRRIRADVPQSLYIAMRPVWSFSGRVEKVDGAPWPECWVLLHDRSAPVPDAIDVGRAMDGDEGSDPKRRQFRLARTDEDGAFAFEDLAWKSVMLSAGGQGHMTSTPLPWSQGRGEEATLTVHRAFAALLEIREEGGGPIVSSRVFASGTRTEWFCEQPGVSSGGGFVPAVLAGLDPAVARRRADRLVCLFVADAAGDEVGPNVLRTWIPGYEMLEARFDARWLGMGQRTHTVFAKRSAEGFGELTLWFVRLPDSLAAVDASDVLDGNLVLTGHGETLEFPVQATNLEPFALDGVPAGAYRARFSHRRGTFDYPIGPDEPISVSVTHEGRSTLDVDLSAMCAFRIDVTDELAHLAADGIHVEVAREVRELVDGRSQWRNPVRAYAGTPPFVFAGYRAGDLHFRIRSPTLPNGGTVDAPRRMTLHPDRVTIVSIQ